MVVKIRLARFGRRHAPFYNIVVAHARTARNSKPLEVIGTYDPIPRVAPVDPGMASLPPAPNTRPKAESPPPAAADARKQKDIRLDVARAQYWLGVGAQPSEAAWKLLSMVGLVQPRWRVGVAPGEMEGGLVKRD